MSGLDERPVEVEVGDPGPAPSCRRPHLHEPRRAIPNTSAPLHAARRTWRISPTRTCRSPPARVGVGDHEGAAAGRRRARCTVSPFRPGSSRSTAGRWSADGRPRRRRRTTCPEVARGAARGAPGTRRAARAASIGRPPRRRAGRSCAREIGREVRRAPVRVDADADDGAWVLVPSPSVSPRTPASLRSATPAARVSGSATPRPSSRRRGRSATSAGSRRGRGRRRPRRRRPSRATRWRRGARPLRCEPRRAKPERQEQGGTPRRGPRPAVSAAARGLLVGDRDADLGPPSRSQPRTTSFVEQTGRTTRAATGGRLTTLDGRRGSTGCGRPRPRRRRGPAARARRQRGALERRSRGRPPR